jgi:O-antigen ligase
MTIANRIAFAIGCIVIVFTTLAYGTVHQPIIAIFYLMVMAMTILWAVDGLVGGTVAFPRSPLYLPIAAACAYGVIQVLPFGSTTAAVVDDVPRTISLDPYWTAAATLHLSSLLTFFFIFTALLSSAARIRKVAVLITVFGFLYAFYSILQFVLSPTKIYGIYESRFSAPFGSFVNRHNFAAFIEMAAAIPLGLVFSGVVPRDKRLLYVTSAVLMAVALFLSGSRGGLVAFLVEIIVLLMLTTARQARSKAALRVALAASIFVVMVAGAAFVGGDTSLTRLAETASENDVTTGRSHIWAVTADVIRDEFPFGAGIGAFPVAYARHDTMSGLERVEQAHNDYLQIAADMGVIGILIGVWFLYLFFRLGASIGRIENSYRRAVGVGAFVGCTGILVHSLFDFVLHTTAITVLFVVLLSIGEGSRSEYPDDVAEPEPDRRFRKKRGTVSPIKSRAARTEAN